MAPNAGCWAMDCGCSWCAGRLLAQTRTAMMAIARRPWERCAGPTKGRTGTVYGCGQCTHHLWRDKAALTSPSSPVTNESKEKIIKISREIMSSTGSQGMSRYKTTHAHKTKSQRRPNDPTSQQAEGPSQGPDPTTHATSQATAATRHQPRNSVRGTHAGSMHTR